MTRILQRKVHVVCVETGHGREWRYDTIHGEKREDGPTVDAVKFTAENYPHGTTIQLHEPREAGSE